MYKTFTTGLRLMENRLTALAGEGKRPPLVAPATKGGEVAVGD